MILRKLEQTIIKRLYKGKGIVVLGPRQTGKTTLLTKVAGDTGPYLLLDCDDSFTRSELEKGSIEVLRRILGKHKLVLIDEAQRVKNIGLVLKLIIDRFKTVQILVSGSSSLDLLSEINEPPTGRKWEYFLYPVSWSEYYEYAGHIAAMQSLESRIIFGMYPDVINNPGEEKEVLRNLTGSLLYKDLLTYQGVRKPDLPENLLRALALQIGNEVSYNELASTLQVDKKTVITYINLLEKAFLIFRLQPFSRNLRNEISTSRKIYFYDTGVRNAIINNFNMPDIRQDTGALWENFLVSERMKKLHYAGLHANSFFWRTTTQREIDYIEESDGKISAFEFKLKKAGSSRFPPVFMKAYPDSRTEYITEENFLDFVM
jgi:uncharacterized protein